MGNTIPSIMPALTSEALSSLDSDTAVESTTRRSRSASFSTVSTLTTLMDTDEDDDSDSDSDDDEDANAKRKKRQRLAGGKKARDASPKKKGVKRRAAATGKDEVAKDGKVYLTAGLYWTRPSGGVGGGETKTSTGRTRSTLSTTTNTSTARSPAKASINKKESASIKAKGKQNETADDTDYVDWRSVSAISALPLPIHFGESLLKQERAFKLPFDIVRDMFDEQGHKRDAMMVGDAKERELKERSRKPPVYKTISRNIYVDRKPDKVDEPAVCLCTIPKDGSMGCGEDCINRLTQFSCSAKSCPVGDKCSNGPLCTQTSVPVGNKGLRVVWTGNRGFGLKTMVDIKKDQFILEYRGEIISRNESYRRVLTEYKDAKSFYFLDYDGDEVIDAGQRGNVSRFINHSCGPNVTVVRWRLSDVEEYQMGIFALQDIPAGTELSYDYGWQDFGSLPSATAQASGSTENADIHRQRCFCGAAACSGWLGGKKEKQEKIQLKKGETSNKRKVGRPRKVVESEVTKGGSPKKAKVIASPTKSKTIASPKKGNDDGKKKNLEVVKKVVETKGARTAGRKAVGLKKTVVKTKTTVKTKVVTKSKGGFLSRTLKKVVSTVTARTRGSKF